MELTNSNPLMNLVGNTDQHSSVQQQGGVASAASSASAQPSLEKSFLTMLTTELKNQDPMNPMDSAQMVTQLSQISTSQGISNLEKLSQSQILALMGNQRIESAQLIGKNVDYKINSLNVNGSKIYSGSAQVAPGATGDLDVIIKDQSGNTIKTMTIPSGSDGNYTWSWDGKDDSGKTVSNGNYSISAKTKDGQDADLLQKNLVSKLDFKSDGNTSLIFANGQSTNIQDVTTIEN